MPLGDPSASHIFSVQSFVWNVRGMLLALSPVLLFVMARVNYYAVMTGFF